MGNMMSVAFAASSAGIVVSQRSDGTVSWFGQYNGVATRHAVPIDGGERCILLLDPDANQRSAFENLLCIDQKRGCRLDGEAADDWR